MYSVRWKLTVLFTVVIYTISASKEKVIDEDRAEPPIHILICVTNVVNSNHRMAHLARMFDSVLRTARRQPLHWIVLTKPPEVAIVSNLLTRIIDNQAKVPVTVEYVNVNLIAYQHKEMINITRNTLLCEQPLNSSRFYDEVFHIGNLHHLTFPFSKLIVLDLDLKFTVDISDLFNKFHAMETTNELVAIAHDLSPSYWVQFARYRKKNPSIPNDKFKGFNTGVLLMDLERMRRSHLYNSYLNETKLRNLISKYEFDGCIAYQDFFTLLGLEHPEWFHLLGCEWNRQLDELLSLDEVYSKYFDYFHACAPEVKVYHANCGSLMPEDDFFPTSV